MKMEGNDEFSTSTSDNDANIPAFLNKLWKMVNDPNTDHLICWAPDGRSFVIQNEAGVWYELLPAYYKHNNMSSFVRQLNMYGFHKISNTENSYMDHDRSEFHFRHQFFQKGRYALMHNIKRKVATTKCDKKTVEVENKFEISRILNEVKMLHGKQAQFDSHMTNLKQENTVLWRELAILRQKHQKQQQLVNKLIQFLVTIVQPNNRMGGLGVKRRYPLMLNEIPKNQKKTKKEADGPTIHELDVDHHLDVPEPSMEQVESPASTVSNSNPSKSPANFLDECELIDSPQNLQDNPEFVSVDDLLNVQDSELAKLEQEEKQVEAEVENIAPEWLNLNNENSKVFLNSTSQDTMLSDLVNGNYNIRLLNNTDKEVGEKKENKPATPKMMVATRDPSLNFTRLNSADEVDAHLENTQSELDQLKEFLNGCNTFDTSCLMNLFNENPTFGLSLNQNTDGLGESASTVYGSEVAPYDSGIVDFTELFDDTSNPELFPTDNKNIDSVMNTPDVSNTNEPTFPQP